MDIDINTRLFVQILGTGILGVIASLIIAQITYSGFFASVPAIDSLVQGTFLEIHAYSWAGIFLALGPNILFVAGTRDIVAARHQDKQLVIHVTGAAMSKFVLKALLATICTLAGIAWATLAIYADGTGMYAGSFSYLLANLGSIDKVGRIFQFLTYVTCYVWSPYVIWTLTVIIYNLFFTISYFRGVQLD